MKEFHVVPNYRSDQHTFSSACSCKPALRNKEDAGDYQIWQHVDPKIPPPIMVSGMMASGGWTLFSTEV